MISASPACARFSHIARWTPVILLAALVGAALFLPDRNPFHFLPSKDGADRVFNDPRARGELSVTAIFAEGYWFPERMDPLYRPLTTLSFWMGNHVGIRPAVAQFGFNLLLHLSNAALVALVLALLGTERRLAVVIACLWFILPGHLEAVVGIAGRADLLALLFGLLCVRAAVLDNFALATAFATAAFLTKESGAVFFVAPVIASVGRGKRIKEALTAFSLGAAAVAAVQLWRHQTNLGYFIPPGDNPLAALPIWKRVGAALEVDVVSGARWLIGPTFFDGSYGAALTSKWLLGHGAESFLITFLTIVAAIAIGYSARRNRMLCLGMAWVCLAFAPVSNVLLPIGTAWGDRLLYGPSVGLALIAAALARHRISAQIPLVGLCAAGLLVVVMELPAWKDPVALDFRFWQASPDSYRTALNCAQHAERMSTSSTETPDAIAATIAMVEPAAILWRESPLPDHAKDARASILTARLQLALAANPHTPNALRTQLLMSARNYAQDAIRWDSAKRIRHRELGARDAIPASLPTAIAISKRILAELEHTP